MQDKGWSSSLDSCCSNTMYDNISGVNNSNERKNVESLVVMNIITLYLINFLTTPAFLILCVACSTHKV